MEVRFWGVRGSYPASGVDHAGFGHHTACVGVSSDNVLVVLDAGTGAAALAEHLPAMLAGDAAPRAVHVLLSHLHHDHVMGLPFLLYALAAAPGVTTTIHSAIALEQPLETTLRTLLSAPYFPDEAGMLFGKVAFSGHAPGTGFALGGLDVRTMVLAHPGGSAAYRLDGPGGALVYMSDVEDAPAPLAEAVSFAAGAELLIHDTMFTAVEIETRRGWGHSTARSAVALADAAGVGLLAGFHHAPTHGDAQLAAREARLIARRPRACLAREGQIITLRAQRSPEHGETALRTAIR